MDALAEAMKAKNEPSAAGDDTADDRLDPSLVGAKIEYRDGEKFISIDDLPPDSEYTPDQMKEMSLLYEDTLTEIKEGQIVAGKIIAISEKDVAVDIGFKSEGTVPIEEFDDPANLRVGDPIEVYLESVEDSEGQLQLSKKKADFMRVWERVREVYESDGIIRGRCVRRIKGGMVVDLGGVDAFLPGSQIDVRPGARFRRPDRKRDGLPYPQDQRSSEERGHQPQGARGRKPPRSPRKAAREPQCGRCSRRNRQKHHRLRCPLSTWAVWTDFCTSPTSPGAVLRTRAKSYSLDQKIQVKVLNYDSDRRRISLGLKQALFLPLG